jgi:hypothetical protein
VIAASALSLLYPQNGIPGYAREAFIDDLVREAQTDIRKCLDSDATVQIDFTEGRYPGCSRTSTGSSSKERGKPLVVPAQ